MNSNPFLNVKLQRQHFVQVFTANAGSPLASIATLSKAISIRKPPYALRYCTILKWIIIFVVILFTFLGICSYSRCLVWTTFAECCLSTRPTSPTNFTDCGRRCSCTPASFTWPFRSPSRWLSCATWRSWPDRCASASSTLALVSLATSPRPCLCHTEPRSVSFFYSV